MVVCEAAVKKVALSLRDQPSYFERLELVQISMRIIGELCKKGSNIRDFVVLNHKSLQYWLKAYKHFGSDVSLEFAQLLEGATNFRFSRSE